MNGTAKQIEWADGIISKAEANASKLVSIAKLRVENGDFAPSHSRRVELITGSLLQDLRKAKTATEIIDRYKGGINLEPIVIKFLAAWTDELEAKLVSKLSA